MKFFRRFKIIGTGSYLPEKVLTNFDLEKMVDTSDEWIRTRTGVEKRHIVRDDEVFLIGEQEGAGVLDVLIAADDIAGLDEGGRQAIFQKSGRLVDRAFAIHQQAVV